MEKQIENFIKEHNGYLIVKKLKEIVPYHKINYYIQQNPNLIKVHKGIYIIENKKRDLIYEATIKNPHIIISHLNAAWIHGLIDKKPKNINVSTHQGNKIKQEEELKLIPKYQKKDIVNLGITTFQTKSGNKIPVYDMDKTICDIIKNKNEYEEEFYNKIWNNYLRNRNKSFRRLSKYSEKMNMFGLISKYMKITYRY